MKKLMDGFILEKNNIEQKTHSYATLRNGVYDKLMGTKIAFFQHVAEKLEVFLKEYQTDAPMTCLLYTSPSPRDLSTSRMPSSP